MLDLKRHFCVLNNESPRTDVWKKQMRKAMRVITKKDKFKPEKLSAPESSFAKRKKGLTMYESDLENPVLVRNPQTI